MKFFLLKRIFHGLWVNFFCFLLNISRRGCQNWILRVQRIILRKTIIVKKILLFSDIERKNFGLLAKIFGGFVKNCILRVHWNILRNFFKFSIFYHFQTLSQNFSAFCGIIRVHRNILGFWKNFPKCEQNLLMLAFSVNAIGKRSVKNVPFERKILLS